MVQSVYGLHLLVGQNTLWVGTQRVSMSFGGEGEGQVGKACFILAVAIELSGFGTLMGYMITLYLTTGIDH